MPAPARWQLVATACAPTWMLPEELQQVLQDGPHAARVLALHVQHNVCRRQQGAAGCHALEGGRRWAWQQGSNACTPPSKPVLCPVLPLPTGPAERPAHPATHPGRAARAAAGSSPLCRPPLPPAAAAWGDGTGDTWRVNAGRASVAPAAVLPAPVPGSAPTPLQWRDASPPRFATGSITGAAERGGRAGPAARTHLHSPALVVLVFQPPVRGAAAACQTGQEGAGRASHR